MPWCLQKQDVDPASRLIFMMLAAATLFRIVAKYDFDGGCCDPIQIHFLLQFVRNWFQKTHLQCSTSSYRHWVQSSDGWGGPFSRTCWADFIYQDELFGGQRFQREKSKYGLSRLQNMPFGSVQGFSWRHVSETVVIQHDQLWLLVNFCPRKASVMRCARSLQSFEWASECSIGYLCCMFLMYDLEGDV